MVHWNAVGTFHGCLLCQKKGTRCITATATAAQKVISIQPHRRVASIIKRLGAYVVVAPRPCTAIQRSPPVHEVR